MSKNELSSWGKFVSDTNHDEKAQDSPYDKFESYCEDNEEELEYDEIDHEPILLNLYDPQLTFAENFADSRATKYILFEVSPSGIFLDASRLSSPGTKVVADFEKFNDYEMYFETMVVDYDTMFGLRLLTFQRYSSFFSCDERVLFEALLIKFRAFNFIPFHWSYTVIFKELGIKKDRAVTIFKRFITLGFLSSEIRTTTIDKNPRQVTYYNILADNVMTLLPEIYFNYEKIESWIENDIATYLEPALKKAVPTGEDKSPPNITQIMQ